ncbi:MAG: PIN domain-containing protein [Candidatus Nanoarchaeia archaeon]|nr:PIN domain-containing protein [Candidatus Nanoarchaeia archaeon]
MDLVVDANILFSVLIKSGKTEELIFDSRFNLFAPEFLFEEFIKYEDFIIKKTGRNSVEFSNLITILKKRIKTISREQTFNFLEKAKEICPDEKDVDYFAIAIKLNCALWSNDKELKNQNKIIIYSTSELLNLF